MYAGCLRVYPQTFHISYGWAVIVPKCSVGILAQACQAVNRDICECVKLYIAKDIERRTYARAIIVGRALILPWSNCI